MKQNILILVNSFISCSKKQYFKTQLINTEHRTQNTDTEHRTQTHVKNIHVLIAVIGPLDVKSDSSELYPTP